MFKKKNIQRLNPNTSIDFLAWTVSQITASQGYFVTNTSEVLSLALKVMSVDRKNPVNLYSKSRHSSLSRHLSKYHLAKALTFLET